MRKKVSFLLTAVLLHCRKQGLKQTNMQSSCMSLVGSVLLLVLNS